MIGQVNKMKYKLILLVILLPFFSCSNSNEKSKELPILPLEKKIGENYSGRSLSEGLRSEHEHLKEIVREVIEEMCECK